MEPEAIMIQDPIPEDDENLAYEVREKIDYVVRPVGDEWAGHKGHGLASVANSHNSGSNFRADPNLNMARRTPLTADTRQECINEGRCFNCREMGHSIRDCPKKKPSTTVGDHLKEQLNYLGHAYSQASDSELDAAFEAEWYGEEDDEEKGEKK